VGALQQTVNQKKDKYEDKQQVMFLDTFDPMVGEGKIGLFQSWLIEIGVQTLQN
jgi:hypothetical protein